MSTAPSSDKANVGEGGGALKECLEEVIDAALRQLAMMGKGREPSPRLQEAIDKARATIAALSPSPLVLGDQGVGSGSSPEIASVDGSKRRQQGGEP